MNKKRDESIARKTKIKRAIFEYLDQLGYFVLSAMAPDAPRRLARLWYQIGNTRPRRYYVSTVINKMTAESLVKIGTNHLGQKVVRLTKLGREELRRYGLGQKKIDVSKKWDGKYRIIIFDIKEWKRGVRDKIRNWLKELGFVQLQRSVWVYPYPCRKVIVLLKAKFKIGHEVLYITADEIENDRWLKKEFSLK